MGNKQSQDVDHGAVGTRTESLDDAAAHMLESSGLSSRVELSIRCEGLANLDSGPNDTSDPVAVVWINNGGRWSELGRTEVIANTLNPVFVRRIIMSYKFEEVQQLRVDVYDVDTPFVNSAPERLELSKQELQGFITCTLAEVCGTMSRTLTKPLQHPQGKAKGTVTLSVEEVANQNTTIRMKLRGQGFSNCQPFVRLSRTREVAGGALDKAPVFKTEVVTRFQAPKTPSWTAFELNVGLLCQGDFFRPIVLEVWDWKRNGQHKLLGEARTSTDELLRGAEAGTVRLELQSKRSGFSGGLEVEAAQLVSHPSFLDYIRGGCEISFIVAIDMTASNGNPMDRNSLHYLDPTNASLNQYQAAIAFVGEVLSFYDSDQRYPVYGFGGQARAGPTLMPVSHCFAVNGDPANPEVVGVQGILEAYARCIRSVNLAGPTIFSQVLGQASSIAAQFHRRTGADQKYFVLLIITDGVINDMDATVNEIIRASALPLSVLIVGVGGADFSNMHVLDGDQMRLQNASGTAARDIVQFVSMREFVTPTGIDRAGFSRALLEELPAQMTSYFAMHQIPPNPPTTLPPPPPRSTR